MSRTYIANTVEILYVVLMQRWQKSAPQDHRYGVLDGVRTCNSQIERLAFILRKIAAGNEQRVYSSLEAHCRRTDGESYVSRNSGWMESPVRLGAGWYLEGCQRLTQKTDIAQSLSYLGHSSLFIACVKEFIDNKDVGRFIPTPEEQNEIMNKLVAAGEIEL